MIRELRVAFDRTADVVAAVPPDRMADPTPCPDMDVRALMNHMVAGNIMFAHVVDGGDFDGSIFEREHLGDDPARAYRQSAELALASWQRPGVMEESLGFGGMPGSVVVGMHLTEELVHGWDLAVATDQDLAIDPDAAELALGVLRPVPEAMLRGPQSFGPEVVVPDGTPTGIALVAFLGRDPASPIAG